MPSAWVLGSIVIKSSLVILIISILMSLLFFCFMAPFVKEKTKKIVDEISTLYIILAISILIGKIMTNIPIFLSDPLAILAYPSDSSAFYVGMLLMFIYSGWKIIKSYDHFNELLFGWMYVFVGASFLYEFTYLVLGNGTGNGLLIVILFLILLNFILLQGKVSTKLLGYIGLLSYSAGQFLLTLTDKTSIFQFYLGSIFYGILFVIGIILFFIEGRMKKK